MESNANICKMNLLFCFENRILFCNLHLSVQNLQMRNISDCYFRAYLLLSL